MKKKFLLVFIAMILFFGLLECWVRVFMPPPYPPRMFERHATRGFSLRKNFKGQSSEGLAVRINSLGLRDRDFPPVPPEGKERILVLGDSVVFGYGVRAEDRFTQALERRLNRERPGSFDGYEVVNAGIPAYNTALELMYLQDEGILLNPHLVLLCYLLNDAEIIHPKGDPSRTGRIGDGLMEFCRLHFRSLIFLKARFRRLGTRMGYTKRVMDFYTRDTGGWEKALSAVNKMRILCDSRGIGFMVILFPRLEGLSENSPYAPIYSMISEQMAGHGIDVVDLFPVFAGREENSLWVSKKDRHPNAEGHRIAARAIYPYLRRRYN